MIITTRPSYSFPPPAYPLGAHIIAGPNDGGIKRGDREDSGDNQADLDDLGTGPAQPTVDPTSLGGATSIGQVDEGTGFNSAQELDEFEGMEVMHEDDGRLGLTGLDGPDEDWAVETGPTRNPEGS